MRFFIINILLFSLLNAFIFVSPDVKGSFKKEQIYNKFNCGGKNISPLLYWQNPPQNTKSFAVTLYDPDAVNGWWHWIVLNIPAEINILEKNASLRNMPKGVVELKNSYGTLGYGGPCPPKGDKAHNYIFTLYALDVLKINSKDIAEVLEEIAKHTIDKASFTASYKR